MQKKTKEKNNSVQCITCYKCAMKERGNCECLLDLKPRKERTSLVVHECNKWKLAPKDSVKSRSKRKMTFTDKGIAVLK